MDTAVSPATPPLTPGQLKLLQAVLTHIRQHGWGPETHLAESSLARLLGTSRSPVRAVLRHLASLGLVHHDRNRGFFLAVEARELPTGLVSPIQSRQDQIYLHLANARFEGRLPETVTESELSRILGASRADMHQALLRAQDEGWAHKTAGYGWEFLPTVDTLDSYDDLYAVRVALEPACVLNPKFRPEKAQLAQLRAEQLAIGNADPTSLDPVELFESNARFHATIAGWSGNKVAIQILGRLDRMRRLAEYRQATRPLPRDALANEHCAILDAIEAGDMLTAAALLRNHLDGARRKKVIAAAFGPQA